MIFFWNVQCQDIWGSSLNIDKSVICLDLRCNVENFVKNFSKASGWSNNIVGNVLDMTDSGSIISTLDGPQTSTQVIPEHHWVCLKNKGTKSFKHPSRFFQYIFL